MFKEPISGKSYFLPTLKFDLDVVYTCYRDENTSKEPQEYILNNFSYFWPLPADSGHDLHQQKSRKIVKYVKKYDFSKVNTFLCGGWKYDFLPEMSSLDPGKYSETPY